MKEVDKLLTDGLRAGYVGVGGEAQSGQTERIGLVIQTRDHKTKDGGRYHDEWIKGSSGGGQEIAKPEEGEGVTRHYVGRVAPREILDSVGTTKKEVIDYLIRKVREFPTTRLEEDVIPDPDKDLQGRTWQYSYVVLKRFQTFGVTVSLEQIFCSGTSVFLHLFSKAPIIIE